MVDNIRYLRDEIIRGNVPDQIALIRDQIYKFQIKNHDYNLKHITEIVEKFDIEYENYLVQIKTNPNHKSKNYILSRLSYLYPNIIDIDVGITVSSRHEKIIYFVGRDLRECYKLLPVYKFVNSRGNFSYIKPYTGTSNCKIYNWVALKPILEIVLNLRMLQIYLLKQKLTTGHLLKTTQILGSSIHFDIPEKYMVFDNISNQEEINNETNPVKLREGVFLFGLNGVSNGKIYWMFRRLFEKFPEYSNSIFIHSIKRYFIGDILLSGVKFIMASWERHQRLLIKVKISNIDPNILLDQEQNDLKLKQESEDQTEQEQTESEDQTEQEQTESEDQTEPEPNPINPTELLNLDQYQIWIIDPWKKSISETLLDKLKKENPYTTFKFIKRRINDQDKEGSCSLCVFSRILYLLDKLDLNTESELDPNKLLEYLNSPITDFFAYLTNFLYRSS